MSVDITNNQLRTNMPETKETQINKKELMLELCCARDVIVQSNGGNAEEWNKLGSLISKANMPIDLTSVQDFIAHLKPNENKFVQDQATLCFLQAITISWGRLGDAWNNLGISIEKGARINGNVTFIKRYIPSFSLNMPGKMQAALCFNKAIDTSNGGCHEAKYNLERLISESTQITLEDVKTFMLSNGQYENPKETTMASTTTPPPISQRSSGNSASFAASRTSPTNTPVARTRQQSTIATVPPSITPHPLPRAPISEGSPRPRKRYNFRSNQKAEPVIEMLIKNNFLEINANGGDYNSVNCAVKLFEILNNGSIQGVKLPAPIGAMGLANLLSSDSGEWGNERISELWDKVKARTGIEDLYDTMPDEKQSEAYGTQISIDGENGDAELITTLQNMPVRKKDGTSLGINLCARNKTGNNMVDDVGNDKFEGHMSIWYVTENPTPAKRQVFIIDPQSGEIYYSCKQGDNFYFKEIKLTPPMTENDKYTRSEASTIKLADKFQPRWSIRQVQVQEGHHLREKEQNSQMSDDSPRDASRTRSLVTPMSRPLPR